MQVFREKAIQVVDQGPGLRHEADLLDLGRLRIFNGGSQHGFFSSGAHGFLRLLLYLDLLPTQAFRDDAVDGVLFKGVELRVGLFQKFVQARSISGKILGENGDLSPGQQCERVHDSECDRDHDGGGESSRESKFHDHDNGWIKQKSEHGGEDESDKEIAAEIKQRDGAREGD